MHDFCNERFYMEAVMLLDQRSTCTGPGVITVQLAHDSLPSDHDV